MTIERIREAIQLTRYTLEECNQHSDEVKGQIKCLETILWALEKQIPKKPIRIKDNMIKDCEWILCPNCKEKITNSITFAKLNYMPEYRTCCGQRLDWSIEK